MVIGIGSFYVNSPNWHSFAPFGYTGVSFLGHTLFCQTAPAVDRFCVIAGASTIVTGLFVSVMAGFVPLSILAEMTSIGTLFAFVIVCGAVLVMRRTNPDANRPFRAPLVPLVPILGVLTCLLLMFSLPVENWYRLIIWMVIGFVLYFSYGYQNSELRRRTEALAAGAPRRR